MPSVFPKIRPSGWLSLIAYNLGNLWRRLVLPKKIDHWSLTSLQQSEDGWAIGEARTLLLAAVSGRASDAAGVRGDFAEDLGAAPADWIERGGGEGNRRKEGGWNGEVSEKSLAIRHSRPFSCPEEADLATSLRQRSRLGWKKFTKQTQAEAVGCIITGTENQNGNPGLFLFAVSILTLTAQNNGREWNGFAAYPGAHQLCDQSVMGQPGGAMMEIHWRSYATPDATANVIAFYEKVKVKDVEKGSDSVTFRLDKDTHLSVYAASAAHYPTCENKPKSDEKTVIVVSRATRR